jgi:hypothetical protein
MGRTSHTAACVQVQLLIAWKTARVPAMDDTGVVLSTGLSTEFQQNEGRDRPTDSGRRWSGFAKRVIQATYIAG